MGSHYTSPGARAKRLLKNTDWEVKEIVKETGLSYEVVRRYEQQIRYPAVTVVPAKTKEPEVKPQEIKVESPSAPTKDKTSITLVKDSISLDQAQHQTISIMNGLKAFGVKTVNISISIQEID